MPEKSGIAEQSDALSLLEPRDSDRWVETLNEAARLLGYTGQQISQWLRTRNCPGHDAERGAYNVDLIKRWIDLRKGEGLDKESADALLKQIKAQRELLLLRQMRGELVTREAVDAALESRARVVRQGLDNLIEDIAQAFPEIDSIRARMATAIDQILTQWNKIGIEEAPPVDESAFEVTADDDVDPQPEPEPEKKPKKSRKRKPQPQDNQPGLFG